MRPGIWVNGLACLCVALANGVSSDVATPRVVAVSTARQFVEPDEPMCVVVEARDLGSKCIRSGTFFLEYDPQELFYVGFAPGDHTEGTRADGCLNTATSSVSRYFLHGHVRVSEAPGEPWYWGCVIFDVHVPWEQPCVMGDAIVGTLQFTAPNGDYETGVCWSWIQARPAWLVTEDGDEIESTLVCSEWPDFDADGDVDLYDYHLFLREYNVTGEGWDYWRFLASKFTGADK